MQRNRSCEEAITQSPFLRSAYPTFTLFHQFRGMGGDKTDAANVHFENMHIHSPAKRYKRIDSHV